MDNNGRLLSDKLRFVPGLCVGLLTGWCQMNNKAIANVHSPVLIGATENLDQISRLWFLVILGLHRWRNL